jgi:hypothetical protein
MNVGAAMKRMGKLLLDKKQVILIYSLFTMHRMKLATKPRMWLNVNNPRHQPGVEHNLII